MDIPSEFVGCAHWQRPFEDVLRAAGSIGTQRDQLLDVRDAIRGRIGRGRPLVMLSPHADDGAITAAALMHECAVRQADPVIEVLVFTGERNVDAPWLNQKSKVSVREAEFRLECQVLSAEPVCWELDAYHAKGYQPSARDIDKIVDWFREFKPGALIMPPATDAHVAHRMARAFAAIGLLGAQLEDTQVLTGWTPWGPLPRPNAYFPYDAEVERTKEWAIHCHASQVLLTDYAEYCTHLGRAYAALVREWSTGQAVVARSSAMRPEESFVGVELYQIENYDPNKTYLHLLDPIQIALGILHGHLSASTAKEIAHR